MAETTAKVNRRLERLRHLLKWWFSNPFAKDGWGRWIIARLLNRRADVCWSKAAMWALFDDFWEVRDLLPGSKWYTGVRSCRSEARTLGTCYCSKFTSKPFAEDAGITGSIIVTEEVEDSDRPELTTFTFKG